MRVLSFSSALKELGAYLWIAMRFEQPAKTLEFLGNPHVKILKCSSSEKILTEVWEAEQGKIEVKGFFWHDQDKSIRNRNN